MDTAWADIVVAYSTGAFLLLGAPDKMRAAGTVVLVAPFADFRAESGRGGKTPAAKLRFLLRWLRRDPLAAVSDFYDRSGLGVPPSTLPYTPEHLIWGIEQLATVAQSALDLQSASDGDPARARPTVSGTAQANVIALAGDCDALLDADGLRGDFPDLQVVAGAGHALADFRKELADALR
ncbi:hypothetical protein H5P28_05105 [Ruficoccus amylovorans]|uniref:Alpha/beta hydrolase n=1 Tax=Ruficoccus amylovorans TaxID=1804625 RepID=A0A842HB65_9BACT|nr:hypothetical protein [Ruficoccus amylovorans]MBC2593635.1 hypothetical protein [Ruficoccus amylovorans]